MSDLNTDEMNGKRPFEERVFARFDAFDARFNVVDSRFDSVDSSIRNLDSRLQNVESRLEKLEIRAYDTKPIWEQALKEIVDTGANYLSVWLESRLSYMRPALI